MLNSFSKEMILISSLEFILLTLKKYQRSLLYMVSYLAFYANYIGVGIEPS